MKVIDIHHLIEDTLPPHLVERMRIMNKAPINPKGRFVLYWMHHAVRSHENPALDTALMLGNHLRLPVLVYQGLSGRHPYNSDRHHTFIMEGARNVQEELGQRRIAFAFYLGRDPAAPGPLQTLAREAAVVITELFPAPPMTQWTASLARKAQTALLAVDCACIVPMQLSKKSYGRAFKFRQDTQAEFDARVQQRWSEAQPEVDPFSQKLEFEAIDFARADIAALCAQCKIDHTVGPIAHTPGGSKAGYARWERFKEKGLQGYARLRNDAAVVFPRGVSRMSPYLHHGQVSPFRIAREAAESGSAGAEKFLDELLIWRELAHNFCFHHTQPEALAVLPEWARRTIDDHRDDRRDAHYSWETLARANTGDPLWDAAQRSLLIHGELHNNVRMTWGKAFMSWVEEPEQALQWMIDLNHRYALDGNDPNSYGGLLWCLGLFDRPFKPPQPVIGTLRPRSTRSHARRLDMEAYRDKVEAPASGKMLNIAVVGAGLSGLFAARTLSDHGHNVTVFETADYSGGRLASIRQAEFAFDSGAQYFTIRDERFRRYISSWQMDGIVKPWPGRIAVVKDGRVEIKDNSQQRWVGVPGQHAIAEHLAGSLDINYGTHVAAVKKHPQGWQLTAAGGSAYGIYDMALIAIPAPSATALLDDAPDVRDRISKVRMTPCLSVMAAFSKPLDLPFDGAFIHGSPLSWIARNNSKPGRPAIECWVLHAGPQWSVEHEQIEPAVRNQSLLESFFQSVSLPPAEPVLLESRYWPNAAAQNPLDAGCIWDQNLRIGVCGDWCQMSRVEGAILSGMAAAGSVLGMKIDE
jgi:photolyase PhrII